MAFICAFTCIGLQQYEEQLANNTNALSGDILVIIGAAPNLRCAQSRDHYYKQGEVNL